MFDLILVEGCSKLAMLLSRAVNTLTYRPCSIMPLYIYEEADGARISLEDYLKSISQLLDEVFPAEYFKRERDAIATSLWMLKDSSMINPDLKSVLLNLLEIMRGIEASYDYFYKTNNSKSK